MAASATFMTSEDIPASYFRSHASIEGIVTRVTDGDTLRILHEPEGALHARSPKGKLSEISIAVRLYGIDAPETAKFGKPGQPMSVEAAEFVKAAVLGKKVKVTLYRRDQYMRVVGAIEYFEGSTRSAKHDLTLELLRNGFGLIYTGGGAEYAGKLTEMRAMQESAKKRRVGVWSTGTDFETPAEYKAKHRQDAKAENHSPKHKGGERNSRSEIRDHDVPKTRSRSHAH